MTGSQNASGGVVTVASSSDTPVTPPSMKPLGSRNPFSPKPADRMPRMMSEALRSSRVMLAR